MNANRRSCLSVGELLTAAAVIVTLAAILLPAFAQARSRARQALCLANIKTIARALRMHLADTEGRLPPVEYDPQALA